MMNESTNASEETPLLSEQVGASTGDGGNSLPGTTANNTYPFGSSMDTAEGSEKKGQAGLKPAHSDDKEDGKMTAPSSPRQSAVEEGRPYDGGAESAKGNEIDDGNSPMASDPTSGAERQTSAKRLFHDVGEKPKDPEPNCVWMLLSPVFPTVLALYNWIASKATGKAKQYFQTGGWFEPGGNADLIIRTVLPWGAAIRTFWTLQNTNKTVHEHSGDLHKIQDHLIKLESDLDSRFKEMKKEQKEIKKEQTEMNKDLKKIIILLEARQPKPE